MELLGFQKYIHGNKKQNENSKKIGGKLKQIPATFK